MAELEKEVVDNENINNEEVVDDEETTDDDFTSEQVLEWKKKAERLEKAEKKLVELKKEAKKKDDNPSINSKEELKKLLAEEKFYDKTPEANKYKEKIEEYQEKGLGLEEAYFLASRNDQEVDENREIYGKSFVKGNQVKEDVSVVSLDTFDRMTPEAQEKYSEKMISKYGKIKLK